MEILIPINPFWLARNVTGVANANGCPNHDQLVSQNHPRCIIPRIVTPEGYQCGGFSQKTPHPQPRQKNKEKANKQKTGRKRALISRSLYIHIINGKIRIQLKSKLHFTATARVAARMLRPPLGCAYRGGCSICTSTENILALYVAR